MLFSSTYRTSSNIGLNFDFEKGSYTPDFTISTYCEFWFVVLFFWFFYNLHFCLRNSEHSFWHWYPHTSNLWKLLDHDQSSFLQCSFIRLFSFCRTPFSVSILVSFTKYCLTLTVHVSVQSLTVPNDSWRF